METEIIPYQKKDALDKKVKPLILKWLADLFRFKDYPHSFKDQWITWTIWDDELSIMFDSRVGEQNKLLYQMPPRFKSAIQYQSLKIVNENTFYIPVSKIGHINYPHINGSQLIHKERHIDNDGDEFFTYDWEVWLDDNTAIMYHNQKEKMDMTREDYVFKSTIQERFFVNFLTEKYSAHA